MVLGWCGLFEFLFQPFRPPLSTGTNTRHDVAVNENTKQIIIAVSILFFIFQWFKMLTFLMTAVQQTQSEAGTFFLMKENYHDLLLQKCLRVLVT